MSFKAFFPTAVVSEEEERVISKRFVGPDGAPIPFRAHAITEAENSKLRKAATRVEKTRGGVRTEYTDHPAYMSALITACLTYPNLSDAELQQAYGVMTGADLVQAMLLPGEYGELVTWLTDLNGFDRDLNELKDEAKN